MLLTVWFSHHRGPYSVTEDRFDSVGAAEEFWRDDPFFISAESLGESPPVAIEHKRHETERGISRAKGSRHTASLLKGSWVAAAKDLVQICDGDVDLAAQIIGDAAARLRNEKESQDE